MSMTRRHVRATASAVLGSALLCASVATLVAGRAQAFVEEGSSTCFAAAREVFLGPPRAGMLAVVNLTPVEAEAPGFGLLVSPDLGPDTPLGSNVNFQRGSVDPNVGAAVTGNAGEVCFTNSVHGDVELVADTQVLLRSGTFSATNSPVRGLDTRVGFGGGRLAPGASRCFGVVGTPGDVVFVNLTPVNASAPGFGVLVAASITSPPPGSNVNFGVGSVDPNVAAAQIGASKEVCFVNSEHASVDLIADQLFTVSGKYGQVMTPTPDRRLDTRLPGGSKLAPSERRCFSVVGDPGDIAVVNLTPVNATGPGFGVLVSSDVVIPPLASTVNFAPGSYDPNVAFTPIGADSNVCFFNSDLSSVDLVADLMMTIDGAAASTGVADRFDTRSPVIASSGCTPVACAAVTSGGSLLRSAAADGPWAHQRLVPNRSALGAIFCTGVWCFFEEPNVFFSPATPVSYGAAWGFNDSTPAGANGWSPVRSVPRGAKACPTDDACLIFSDFLGPYGLTMSPYISITRNGGLHWSMVDVGAAQPPLESYSCVLSSAPGSSCDPRPDAMFRNPSCPSATVCTVSYWTGDLLILTTTDSWATVDIERGAPLPIDP